MTGPLVYVDTSEVRAGSLERLRAAIPELVAFIEANVPRILAYSVHLSDDGTEMTVVHVHSDAASLEQHLEIGAPAFRRFADLLRLQSIHVYGQPSDSAVAMMRDKARMLGAGEVVVRRPEAGFLRLDSIRT
jgi:hypothetical protein